LTLAVFPTPKKKSGSWWRKWLKKNHHLTSSEEHFVPDSFKAGLSDVLKIGIADN
jgi:hypothetical protein